MSKYIEFWLIIQKFLSFMFSSKYNVKSLLNNTREARRQSIKSGQAHSNIS